MTRADPPTFPGFASVNCVVVAAFGADNEADDVVLPCDLASFGAVETDGEVDNRRAVPAEAAAVGRPDELKGHALVVFVTLKAGKEASEALKEELRAHVGKEIGSLAKPDTVRFAAALPKTRSGKIMRRILKEIAVGGAVKGDTTTLEDFSVVASLQSEE